MSDIDFAVAHLEARMLAEGVASVKVDDGQIFLFSQKFIQNLVERLNDSGRDRIMVFVKSGPKLTRGDVQ